MKGNAARALGPVIGVEPAGGAAVVARGRGAVAVGGAFLGGQPLEHGVVIWRHAPAFPYKGKQGKHPKHSAARYPKQAKHQTLVNWALFRLFRLFRSYQKTGGGE